MYIYIYIHYIYIPVVVKMKIFNEFTVVRLLVLRTYIYAFGGARV